MKIEVLVPELCCLYGDKANTRFLEECIKDAEIIYTSLNDKPAFLSGNINLVCLHSMSEQSQERIIDRLLQYKEEIKILLRKSNTKFFLTGNALELFGQYIEREDGSKVEGLGIFSYYSKRHAPNRYNSLLKAKFKDMILLGYTSRFSETYGIKDEETFLKVEVGAGSNEATKNEGIYSGNVIGTYMLGPVLVSNPDFALWFLKEIGSEVTNLPFEKDIRKAYDFKLKEFLKPELELE